MTPDKGSRKNAMKGKKNQDEYLHVITMLDPAMDQIEIHSVPRTKADLVANQVEQAWLTRYLLPDKIIIDRDKKV